MTSLKPASASVPAMAWFGDGLRPLNTLALNPADRGLLLGDGLFETVRVHQGHMDWAALHEERMRQGCGLLNMPALPAGRFMAALNATRAANQVLEGSLRLTWTRGPAARGLVPPSPERCQPTLLITASHSVGAPSAKPGLRAPATIMVARQRRDADSILAQVKSLSALPAVVARLEAHQAGCDDALMANHHGQLAEATAANLVALMGERLTTPPLHDGALPGTSRARLLQRGLVVEGSCTEATLAQARGLWLVNALGITPVRAWRDGQGRTHDLPLPGTITEKLRHFLYDRPKSLPNGAAGLPTPF
ncbi:aminotransferase class IV [Formicincola oecophyllae]|nr:aminotransferase class IV [Formicincola oecophyllae]